MEEDFFLKNMKGVTPIKKEKIILRNKVLQKKITKKLKINKTIILNDRNNKEAVKLPNYKISFGEINKDLKKGKIKIDRRLDLHGYGLLDAQEKFKYEVIKMFNQKKRCILVITGKGTHISKENEIDDNEKPIKLFHGKIKNSIISWIKEEQLKKYILTYQNAGIEHGGEGAIFVYLRRNKN